MRELMIKLAGLLAAVPALSAVLHYAAAGRVLLACFFAYIAWACYALVSLFLAIKCGLGYDEKTTKQHNSD